MNTIKLIFKISADLIVNVLRCKLALSALGGAILWVTIISWSGSVCAAVVFQAAGTAASGTGNVSPAWPTHQAGDIGLLIMETGGSESVGYVNQTEWVEVNSYQTYGSPQTTNVSSTNGTRITVYWARATSSGMNTPTINDPGNHIYAQIVTYRGAVTTGNPWDVTSAGIKSTASTSVSVTGLTTTVPNTLIVQAVTRDTDSNATGFSAQTNSTLTSITERVDSGTTAGNGGGLSVWDGIMTAVGATGNTTATVSSSQNAFLSLALKPALTGGSCSPSLGKVVFNEVYDPASGTAFLEIKTLDPGILSSSSNFAGWTIDLYKKTGAAATTVDSVALDTAFATIGTNSCGVYSAWIKIPDTAFNNKIDGSNGGSDLNFVMSESGRIVDVLRLGAATTLYTPGSSYQTCSTIESALPSNQYDAAWGSNGNKDWSRDPDGVGPWVGSGTSNNSDTTCGNNAGGSGTFGLAKVASTTSIPTNINFNYTLWATNGGTAVTTPASVVITDTLPSGVSFVSCSALPGTTSGVSSGPVGTCTHSAGVVTWTIGTMPANIQYKVILTVKATTIGVKSNTITSNVGSPVATATAANVNVYAPLADWHMDEGSWNGTANEVLDSSGANNHGKAMIANGSTPRPTTATGSPAYSSGSDNTCNYGQFDSTTATTRTYTYVELSNMPVLPASFTFVAWIRSTNPSDQHQRILVRDDADNGWGLSLADGTGQPKLRFFNRNINNTGTVTGQGANPSCGVFCLDTDPVITANNWHYIAASIDTVGKVITLYVYNASGGLLAKTSSAFSGTWQDGTGKASIGGETSASSEGVQTSWHFLGNIDEVQVYSGVLAQTDIQSLLTRVRTCTGTAVVPAKFNCIESGATADTGHLYTKLAGTAFGFDVAALNSSGAVETNFVSGVNKNVTVELGYATDSACTGWTALSPAISQTLTFASTDLGRKAAANVTVSKAYSNLRCRVTDANQTPNVVACSADNFAVRPTKLTVTSTDATADNTGASKTAMPKIKAGANFNLTATAWAGYDGSPKIDLTKVTASASNNGTLGGALGAAAIATGIASSTSMTYSEVGYFNFAINGVYDDTFTAIDQSADCAVGYSNVLDVNGKYGCNFGNDAASNYFGRFVPDHFDTAVVLTSGVPMSCATLGLAACPTLYPGFVYSGQPSTAGQSFTTQITARNLVGGTTKNYNNTDGYSKAVTLKAWDALGSTTTQNPGPGTLANSSVLASAFSNGVASPANISYSFGTAPMVPTAIYLRAEDTDSVTSLRATPANSVEGGVMVVSGRLKVSNAYGSELLPLSVVASAQYYGAASSWLSNVADTVTTLTFPTTFAVGTGSTSVTLVPVSGVLSSGTLTVNLSKPGTAGVATIAPTTFPAYLPVTSGKATFGIYKTNNNFIYQRESY